MISLRFGSPFIPWLDGQADLRQGEGVIVGGGVEQVGDLLGAEEHIDNGVPVSQKFGCEGGFTTTDAGELFFGVLFDLVGDLLVVGAEGFDVGLSLPLEGEGVVAAGSFSQKCHARDPIPATLVDPSTISGWGWRWGGAGQCRRCGQARQVSRKWLLFRGLRRGRWIDRPHDLWSASGADHGRETVCRGGRSPTTILDASTQMRCEGSRSFDPTALAANRRPSTILQTEQIAGTAVVDAECHRQVARVFQ